ncbi:MULTISPECIES: hypothetical protein [unclassified Nocardiopsis]|nr:hypothetical protein [Nocardiopsis sp. TSRI0078]
MVTDFAADGRQTPLPMRLLEQAAVFFSRAAQATEAMRRLNGVGTDSFGP